MQDQFLITGLGMAGLLGLVYVLVRLSKRNSPDLAEGVRLFTGSLGFMTGVKIVAMAVRDPRLAQLTDGERAYIVLGGAAASWVSAHTLAKVFIASTETKKPENDKVNPPPAPAPASAPAASPKPGTV